MKEISMLRLTLFSILIMVEGHAYSQPDASSISMHLEKAEKGDAKSALWLAHFYEKYGDSEKSLIWLRTAAKYGSRAAIIEIGYENPYITSTTMNCGNISLKIETSCSRIDSIIGLPQCYLQHFEFRSPSGEKDFFFINENYKSKYALAMQAKCIDLGLEKWIAIESSNLGSGKGCIDCERTDFFNDEKYIGSLGKLTDIKLTIGQKKLSDKQVKLLELNLNKKPQTQEIDIQIYPVIN